MSNVLYSCFKVVNLIEPDLGLGLGLRVVLMKA